MTLGDITLGRTAAELNLGIRNDSLSKRRRSPAEIFGPVDNSCFSAGRQAGSRSHRGPGEQKCPRPSSQSHLPILNRRILSRGLAARSVDRPHLMAWSEHTTKAFDSDLQDLARAIAEMGGLAERQIAEAIEALTTRDSERAWRVINADATIDNMQRAVEERAIETIARRQPVAIDLRQVVGILRIANELERIGDLAKNIGKRIIAINGEDMPRRSLRGVSHMASLMLAQLRDVLDSFARRDAAKAIEVWTRDQDVDRLYTSLFRELLVHMTENPVTVTFGIHLLFCTKNLERMGDHATNIAEAVYYMVNGQSLLRERPKADVTSMLTGAMSQA
jgi:phosphate transport system protein